MKTENQSGSYPQGIKINYGCFHKKEKERDNVKNSVRKHKG